MSNYVPTQEMMTVLKNFSEINQSLVVEANKNLKTILAGSNTVLASSKIDEPFPVDFAIYDLSEFLNVLRMFAKPELDFLVSDKFVRIIEGNGGNNATRYVDYYYGNKALMSYTSGVIDASKIPFCINFTLTSEDIGAIIKSANVLGLTDLQFSYDKEKSNELSVIVHNSEISTTNVYRFSVQAVAQDVVSCSVYVNMDYLKLVQDNYDVSLSTQGMAIFEGNLVQYAVSLQNNSKFTAVQ